MFTVTVEGQYYAQGKKLKPYSYKCNLPDMTKPLSIVKGQIEARKMPQLYEDFVAVRTRAIVDVQTDDPNQAIPVSDNVHQMTIDQLKDRIILKKLPIDINSYSDVLLLRKDVADAEQNLELFLETKKERAAKAAEAQELDDLNPDLAEEEREPGSLTLVDDNPLKGLE